MPDSFAAALEKSLSYELEDEETDVEDLGEGFLAVARDGETVLLVDVDEGGEAEPSRVFGEGYGLGLSTPSYLGICRRDSMKLYEYDEELGEWASEEEEEDEGFGSGLMALEAESKEDQLNTYMVISEEVEEGAEEAADELVDFLERYVLD